MSSKTRIVVLHSKELIYTGIFVLLGILLIILLIFMFLPGNKAVTTDAAYTTEELPPEASLNGWDETASTYIPGIYTSSIILGNSAVDIEVSVDKDNINSIRLVNLDDAVATMYPLIQPSFDDLITQIYENQTLEGIIYADENKYTSMVLIEAIDSALGQALNVDATELSP